jgi:uncharacterized protein
MDEDLFDRQSERRARRDERRRAVRRRRIALIVVLVSLLAVVAVAFAVSGDGAEPVPGDAGQTGGGAIGATSSAPVAADTSMGASAAPKTAAQSTPEPTSPPLRRPTKRDPLRVYFGGDSLSGMPAVMFEQRAQRSGLMKLTVDYQESSRLTVPDPIDWTARLRSKLDARPYDVSVFLIGANDTGMPMLVDGERKMYPSKAWLQEYEDRVESLMLTMLQRGVDRVYWAGLPVMPKYGQNEAVKDLNEVFAAAAARHPDVVYVDTYTPLATNSGAFNASLRSGDGVHFTNEGAERLADAVWEAMRADWQKPRSSPTPNADQASP